jgi:hypothetical protein
VCMCGCASVRVRVRVRERVSVCVCVCVFLPLTFHGFHNSPQPVVLLRRYVCCGAASVNCLRLAAFFVSRRFF